MTKRSPNTTHRSGELREPAHSRESDRPFVRLNLAISADGKIATANRAISSFGSPRDLARLYRFREQADAILCGAGTINAENADLGPRPGPPSRRGSAQRQLPLRVVVSGRGNVDPDSRLFLRALGPVIILATRRISKSRLCRLQRLAHTVKICGARQIDFLAALRWLRSEWNVRKLVCEGGSQVNASLIEADLVDEINLTICPWVVGGRQAPTIADGRGEANLANASNWRLDRVRRFENELFLTHHRIRERAVSSSARRGKAA
jgi:riboflavin-specific deaminase-like protein